MSWRTTGILFVVLLIVVAVAVLQNRDDGQNDAGTMPTAQAPPSESVALFDGTTEDDFVRLDITLDAGSVVSFNREDDGRWFMTTPTATEVLSQTVTNTLIGLINTASRRTFSAEQNQMDDYGLSDPAREIVLAVSREERVVRYRLQIGNETPAGDGYYLLKEGDRRVHILMKSIVDRIFELASAPPFPEDLPTPMPAQP